MKAKDIIKALEDIPADTDLVIWARNGQIVLEFEIEQVGYTPKENKGDMRLRVSNATRSPVTFVGSDKEDLPVVDVTKT